ncbi:DUF4174 domain-containing protein [Seohaeicola saemankumensis]|uniref:DUF4174 domain-containing protein n=1 Tax=Seohaeicola saemankumensis TaxID=481181 RepID=UPI001E4AD416|nr:DUF4174 domain-containing protein [Seohaeicola saemankumensis]MCD1625480.1 DUF4174 domain-containing protein [Seohaeicola saemankumensis]
MKKILAVVFAGLLAFPAGAADTAEGPPELPVMSGDDVDLKEFLWIKRPIVVFADTPNDPSFIQQMDFLEEDIPAILLRDIIVVTDTDPAAKSELRRTLRPRGFMLVLMDKDGGVKMRKPAPWDMREIRRSIDKWPTRQQEIRDNLGKE